MIQIKPKNYTKGKKLVCDWTDKKNFLIKYRIINFLVRYGMIVDKIHEIIPIKQNRRLEKYINFNTKKRNRAENDFEICFYKQLHNAFYGRTMENVRNRLRLELLRKDDTKKIY